MKFKLDARINDGLSEAPPLEVMVATLPDLWAECETLCLLCNDESYEPYLVGATLLITRVA